MDAKKTPPEDLLLIKKAVEGQIIPAIEAQEYLDAEVTIGNVLETIDQTRIRMEHCGMGLLASLSTLERSLRGQRYDLLEGIQARVKAYLAQSLMYYESGVAELDRM